MVNDLMQNSSALHKRQGQLRCRLYGARLYHEDIAFTSVDDRGLKAWTHDFSQLPLK